MLEGFAANVLLGLNHEAVDVPLIWALGVNHGWVGLLATRERHSQPIHKGRMVLALSDKGQTPLSS